MLAFRSVIADCVNYSNGLTLNVIDNFLKKGGPLSKIV